MNTILSPNDILRELRIPEPEWPSKRKTAFKIMRAIGVCCYVDGEPRISRERFERWAETTVLSSDPVVPANSTNQISTVEPFERERLKNLRGMIQLVK